LKATSSFDQNKCQLFSTIPSAFKAHNHLISLTHCQRRPKEYLKLCNGNKDISNRRNIYFMKMKIKLLPLQNFIAQKLSGNTSQQKVRAL